MRFKWILFDADNTLFDYDAAEAGALLSTFEEIGEILTAEKRKVYQEINHRNWQAFERGEITQDILRTRRFAQFMEALGLPHNPEEISRRYLFHLGNRVDLIDGASELVRALSGQTDMLIITNGLKEVQRSRMEQSEIKDYFKDIVISEEVGFAKPDERIFDVAFEKMGNPPREDVLIVGDSLTSDIQGGVNYGVATCWFNPGNRPNNLGLKFDYEISRLDQLPSIIQFR